MQTLEKRKSEWHPDLERCVRLLRDGLLAERLHRGPEISHAAGAKPRGFQGTDAGRFPQYRWLESGAAFRQRAPQQLVGDVQRSRAEQARRAGQHFEPDHRRRDRQFFCGARDCPRGAVAVFPHGHRRSRASPAPGRFPRGSHISAFQISGLLASFRCHLGSGFVGARAQYGARQRRRGPGERGRP